MNKTYKFYTLVQLTFPYLMEWNKNMSDLSMQTTKVFFFKCRG